MDPSEQGAYNNESNPEDAAVENFDESTMRQVDDEEHVLGILEIQEIPNQATLILQPEGLNLDGQHIYIEHNSVNGEYFVVVQENISGEGSEEVLNEDDEEKLEQGNEEDSRGTEDRICESFEQQCNLPSESTHSSAEGEKHEKLLHLAVVAQELQSADANSGKPQHIQGFQCSQSIPEESVIVSQIHTDTDSALYRSSETEVSSSTDLASEQDSHSDIVEVGADPNVQAEIPTIKRKTSFSCISSTRTLDNTVSVIHTTSSTYIQGDLEKGVESNCISNDYNVGHASDVSITKSDLVAALHDVSHDDCSNPNEILSNQDGDRLLSQNCGLDLTKDSNVDDPAVNEDSFPAVEHSRSRYGIMDSLNKDKQNLYYDTNASEDIEDTINSCSRSTNITDDIDSASDNNSNQMEHNNEEIVAENNESSEDLGAEKGNLNVECVSTIVEACGDSNPEISQDSKTEDEKKETDQGKRKLRSFNLPSNDNSNSKCSVFSDNVQSPSLLTKDLNSVKRRGRPSRKTKKAMDAYEFDEASVEKDQLNMPESEPSEILEDGTVNSNISASKLSHSDEVVEEGSALKLTFHEALSSVLDKESNKKILNGSTNSDHNVSNNSDHNGSTNSDQSADLFDGVSEVDENNGLSDNRDEITSNHESVISKQEDNLNGRENAFSETLDTQNSFNEPSSNIGEAVPDLIDPAEHLQMPSQKTILEEKVDYDLVKPPRKTYNRKRKVENDLEKPLQNTCIIKRKVDNDREKAGNDKDRIELFSCDDLSSTKDNKNPLNVDSQKDVDSTGEDQVKEFGMDDDGMESNVQSKVSATYKRKRKNVPPIVRANRTRSLRKRSSKAIESEEDEEEGDSSLRELEEHLNSQEAGKVNEHNWGHILLGTKFSSEPGTTDTPTISSTITNSSSPSRNRKRPAWFTTPNSNKSQLTSGKQFDKLIKSSPSKVKCRTSNEKKKLRDKIKKQAMSLCNNLLPNSPRMEQKRGRPKTKVIREPYREVPLESNGVTLKRCGIKYLCERPVGSNPIYDRLTSGIPDPDLFYCSNKCGFVCSKINNLIYHRKNCSSEFDSNDLEDSSKLFCDMDKRQRIRGETKSKEKECNGSSTDWKESQATSSKTYQRKVSDKEKYDRGEHVKKFGFAERDIVWFKRGRQYWPALAWSIHDEEALFYIITAPDQWEAKTIQVHLLKKYVHSFDDIEWSKKILEGNKKTKDINYIKAIQKAHSYIRKKVLLESAVDAKKFFDIKDDTESSKVNGSSESEMDNEKGFKMDYESPISLKDNEEVDVSKIMKCIAHGDCDQHIVSIYRKEAPSERHEMFFCEEHEVAQQLEDMSWFGPFKTNPSMQLELYDHFYELYKRTIAGAPNVSYIYKVWIPEGIIKAISLVNRISLTEAELIFLRQEIQSRLPYDPLEGSSPDSSSIGTSPISSPKETSPNSSPSQTSQMLEASPTSP